MIVLSDSWSEYTYLQNTKYFISIVRRRLKNSYFGGLKLKKRRLLVVIPPAVSREEVQYYYTVGIGKFYSHCTASSYYYYSSTSTTVLLVSSLQYTGISFTHDSDLSTPPSYSIQYTVQYFEVQLVAKKIAHHVFFKYLKLY